MFSSLGRVKEDGTWTDERKKLCEFLEIMGKESDHETLVVSVKGKKQSRNEQTVECLKLESTPIVLTQFKPTSRKGQEALDCWVRFMKFVDDLLTSLEVHKYIVTDKSLQMGEMERLVDCDGSPVVANKQTNTIMAKIVGVYDKGINSLSKDDLRTYQNQTTIDLLEAREFVLDKFVNAYEFTGSHKEAGEMALKLAKKKYKLD